MRLIACFVTAEVEKSNLYKDLNMLIDYEFSSKNYFTLILKYKLTESSGLEYKFLYSKYPATFKKVMNFIPKSQKRINFQKN